MRIAFFGSGSPMSALALDAVAAHGTVVAVVVPAAVRGRGPRALWRALARRRAARVLTERARGLGARALPFARGRDGDLAAALSALRPDLVCVATFPYLVPPTALALAPLGALGLHPSLLPRHRGPDPLFWSYFDGDDVTGVSVFRLDEGADTGPVVAQETVALPRGRPGHEVYDEIARRGAGLLAAAVARAAAGKVEGVPQDEGAATRQPAPSVDTCRVALGGCAAAWLWHFLRGVGHHRPLVRAAEGVPLLHGAARDYRLGAAAPPGTVQRHDRAWRLHCRDGHVEVEGAPWTLAAHAPFMAARPRVLPR